MKPGDGLKPGYTFGRFRVNKSNLVPYSASLAVAERPGYEYNPLYIHGGVGVGKTHLLHAIGNRIKEGMPGRSLMYLTTEDFMNELIGAIHRVTTPQFQEKYRSVDVLLIDDVQFLAGKERTQKEFFHTFNALYDAQKQIVVAASCPPREIPTLEERLSSRLEWGLVADIQPPDLEVKIAILNGIAEAEHATLPDDVTYFIAYSTGPDIRELEGAANRLMAYCSLFGEPVTLELAQRVLPNLTEQNSRIVSMDSIQSVVAKHYNLRPAELKAQDNSRRVVEPRQVAMYLSRKLTGRSLPEIGRAFGGKHHTTVLHSIRKVEKMCSADPGMKYLLQGLEEQISK